MASPTEAFDALKKARERADQAQQDVRDAEVACDEALASAGWSRLKALGESRELFESPLTGNLIEREQAVVTWQHHQAA